MAGRQGFLIVKLFTITVLFSDSRAGEGAPQKIDHAVIGGVVAVVMFAILCALIVLGRYFARHKGKTPAACSYLIINIFEFKCLFFPLQEEFNEIEVHKWTRRRVG